MSKLTSKQREELQALAGLPDQNIDTSDVPEAVDWSTAERGKFYRPGSAQQIPIYLDTDLMEFLSQRAERRQIDTETLVNELLRNDVELIKAAE
ncbi:MAG: CopG family antitoxin [Pseudomonadota bacterium]|jgi:uncharacterized protein (DUF4415 family)|nr:CopG family antitoxin [Pseudomonadota bacterium]